MTDVLLILSSVVLFGIALAYTTACDRLKVKKSHD